MDTINVQQEDFFHVNHNQSAQSFLNEKSEEWKIDLDSEQFSIMMDNHDPLKHLRQEFHYPKSITLPYGLLLSLIFDFFN